jgi:hypothetical protein
MLLKAYNVPLTITTAPTVNTVGTISVACHVVGLIFYRSGEIRSVHRPELNGVNAFRPPPRDTVKVAIPPGTPW